MRSELLVAHEKLGDGVCFTRVRWKIYFLLTFKTAPFFCERTVYTEKSQVSLKIWYEWRVRCLKTYVDSSYHLGEFFLKWEIFQINNVEKFETHFTFNKSFLRKSSRLRNNVEKLGRARIVADENTAHALCTVRLSFSGNKPILQPEVSSTDTTSNTAENKNLFNLQKAHLPTERQQNKFSKQHTQDRNNFDCGL
jgi:hypothetical protein